MDLKILNKPQNQNIFRALADQTRRDILILLSCEDMTIDQVSGHFSMTRAAVKKHLTILEEGNLISVTTKGREKINHMEKEALKPVSEWINYFNIYWDNRLDALADAIDNNKI